jgi:hypothetical protein
LEQVNPNNIKKIIDDSPHREEKRRSSHKFMIPGEDNLETYKK